MSEIKVVSRDGVKRLLDITRIQKKTKPATDGLSGVSQSELEVDSRVQFRDGITTREIQDTLVKTAVDKIDVDRPNWTFVAARLALDNLYHDVSGFSGYHTLAEYFEKGESTGRIILGLKDKFNLIVLEKVINPERDKQFNYLGFKTLYDRYLLKDINGTAIELPQHMFMGISMFLAQLETSIPNDELDSFMEIVNGAYAASGVFLPAEDDLSMEFEYSLARTYWAMKFYDMISTFEVMLATPTLSNARTPRHQLSSCYIGATPDNIEGIFDTYKDQAMLSKFGGGIGWDWTDVRSMGSFIDGHKNAAGGAIPFLKIENDIAIAVDQLGTRKGAIAVYLEPWHMDILDFLDLKKNSGEERRRAHDLFPALWINDLFMERVQADGNWTLFDSYDTGDLHTLYGDEFRERYELYEQYPDVKKETLKAKDLWKKILTSYFETGVPFLCFKDNANRANPNDHCGVIRSSNLCTEIFQNTSPNTYKIKLEMESGEILLFDPQEIVRIDGEIRKPANKISTIDTIDGERIFFIDKETIYGDVAVCNLASVNLSVVNTPEKMAKTVPIAIRALDNVIDLNFYPIRQTKVSNMMRRPVGLGVMGEMEMLANSGIHFGSQEHLEKIDSIMEHFSYNAILGSALLAEERGSYPQYEGSTWSRGVFPIDQANPKAMALTIREKECEWDALRTRVMNSGMRNGYLMAIAPTSSISILTGTTQAVEPIYKRKWFEENLSGLIPVIAPKLSPETWEYYRPAFDINQLEIISAAAVRQKWIDQGQSLNIFMRLDKASAGYLNKIYFRAWEYGLKSTYYLRSQSPEAAAQPDVEDRSLECVGCQ